MLMKIFQRMIKATFRRPPYYYLLSTCKINQIP
nr:MAG TPA: hypothetical protein [Caudoviricetes sp.]